MSEDRMRAITFAYEADDDEQAAVFAVVLASVAENFTGVTLHEVVDESLFEDREDHGAVDALYEALTADGTLTEGQRKQLGEFGAALREWAGGE